MLLLCRSCPTHSNTHVKAFNCQNDYCHWSKLYRSLEQTLPNRKGSRLIPSSKCVPLLTCVSCQARSLLPCRSRDIPVTGTSLLCPQRSTRSAGTQSYRSATCRRSRPSQYQTPPAGCQPRYVTRDGLRTCELRTCGFAGLVLGDWRVSRTGTLAVVAVAWRWIVVRSRW